MLEFIVLGHIPFTSIYLPFGVTMVLIGLIVAAILTALIYLSLQKQEETTTEILESAA